MTPLVFLVSVAASARWASAGCSTGATENSARTYTCKPPLGIVTPSCFDIDGYKKTGTWVRKAVRTIIVDEPHPYDDCKH